MRKVKVAATQMSCSWNREEVLDKAEKLVRKAAAEGANIILLQELFETPYFCQKQKFEYFDLAKPLSENAAVKRFTEVAKELQVVLPISFYEKAGNTAFNTIAIIDADGTILGTYRKTHIPDGLPYADDDDKIRLNQRKPSKYKGLSRFGPEKNLQRINKFMKERPTFYKKLIQMKENFRFYLRCFYCITKVVILQFNSEKQDRISS